MKTLRGLGAISLVGLLVGCVPVTVGTDFRPGVNVSHYRTYTWMSEDQPRTGDPRLDE